MRWSTFEGLRLLTLPGVFLPTRSDTALLWRTVQDLGLPVDGRVLEVCTGSGALALSAARCGGTVTAVDLTRRAVATVRANAALHRLRVDVRRGDLLAPVRGERFDLVLSNPPYLPVPPGGDRSAASLAWDGGPDGRALLDRLCRGVAGVLAPGGTVAIVHSSLADLDRTEALLAETGLAVDRPASFRGPLGALASAHAAHLRGLGVVTDELVEEMAVITGRAPA